MTAFPFNCRDCDVEWGGQEACHCCRRTGGCGEVFSTIRNFDAHRTGDPDDRRCLHPRSCRPRMVVVREPGVWGRPGPAVAVAAARISAPKTRPAGSGRGRRKAAV